MQMAEQSYNQDLLQRLVRIEEKVDALRRDQGMLLSRVGQFEHWQNEHNERHFQEAVNLADRFGELRGRMQVERESRTHMIQVSVGIAGFLGGIIGAVITAFF